jgi:hypothetical protein
LAFPNIVNGDFMVAAQYGEGVLIKDGQVASHDNAVAGSYGFQAGGTGLWLCDVHRCQTKRSTTWTRALVGKSASVQASCW